LDIQLLDPLRLSMSDIFAPVKRQNKPTSPGVRISDLETIFGDAILGGERLIHLL
jgi:hypothetical protein